jgi:CheY-like chemotaxis protein
MTPKTILVAEDDPVTRETLAAQLRAVGYQVVTAMDAMQTVMVAQRSGAALVLLDIQMPGGTGLDALKRIRASTKTQGIPVIVISGSDVPDLANRAAALGAVEVLTKPVDFPRLKELLTRLVGAP